MKSKTINRWKLFQANKRVVKLKKGVTSKIKVKTIIYDTNLDILELYSGSKTHHCVKMGDLLILHCNEKNKIVGLEFLDISTVYNLNKTVLNNLKSAKIIVNTIPEQKKIFITAKLLSVVEKKEINLLTDSSSEPLLVCN